MWKEETFTLSAQKTEMILLKGTLDSRRPLTLKLQGKNEGEHQILGHTSGYEPANNDTSAKNQSKKH